MRRSRKTFIVGAEVTSGGKLFQRRLPATGNARLPMVDSRVRRITSCEDDDDRRRQRLESATRWIVGKIPRRQTMQASVNEHSQLEIDAFRRPQPVKVLSIGVTCSYREDLAFTVRQAWQLPIISSQPQGRRPSRIRTGTRPVCRLLQSSWRHHSSAWRAVSPVC